MEHILKIISGVCLSTCFIFANGSQIVLASSLNENVNYSTSSSSEESIGQENSDDSSLISTSESTQIDSSSENNSDITSESTSTSDSVSSEVVEIEAFSVTDGLNGFVKRLYVLIHDRTPSSKEIQYWVDSITSGKETAASTVWYFLNSSEFKGRNVSDEDYVEILYLTMLDRRSDSGGFNFWLNRIKNGLSRDYVLREFIISPEFTDICSNYGVTRGIFQLTENRDKNIDVTTFVSRFYTNCLGRKFDVGGLNYWTGQLVEKKITGATFILNFFACDEYLGRNRTNEEFLDDLYRTMFGRAPDSGGKAFWLGYLNQGYSRRFILNRFAVSNEFLSDCSRIGINSGTISLSTADYPSATSSSTLTVTMNGKVVTGNSADILSQIVMAEVGGFNDTATYQAQAIAAHSYILASQQSGTVAPSVPGKTPTQDVKNAVTPVADKVLYYNGQVAFTPYFASSAGTTNASSVFWGQGYPYLVQVDSSYDVEASNYQTTKTISKNDFKTIIQNTYPGNAAVQNILDTQDPSTWIVTPSKTNGSKYYSQKYMVSVCGRTPSVEYFYQNMVGLRSAAFDVQYDSASQSFTFTSYGYGHGVGMSQWGAYFGSTKNGWNYSKILSHYYPGTTLGNI